jgi:type IV secretory pathway TrbD component
VEGRNVVVSRVGEARRFVVSTDGELNLCGFSIVVVDLVVKLWILSYHT